MAKRETIEVYNNGRHFGIIEFYEVGGAEFYIDSTATWNLIPNRATLEEIKRLNEGSGLGGGKINTIKSIRQITGLGLLETKLLVEHTVYPPAKEYKFKHTNGTDAVVTIMGTSREDAFRKLGTFVQQTQFWVEVV